MKGNTMSLKASNTSTVVICSTEWCQLPATEWEWDNQMSVEPPCDISTHALLAVLLLKSTTPKTLQRTATCHMGSAASQGIQCKAPSVAAQVQNPPALCQVAHGQSAVSLVCIEACLLASACRHPKPHPILFYLCHNVQASENLDSTSHTESCCRMTMPVSEARFAICALSQICVDVNVRSLFCNKLQSSHSAQTANMDKVSIK